jgi:hypothetical protein
MAAMLCPKERPTVLRTQKPVPLDSAVLKTRGAVKALMTHIAVQPVCLLHPHLCSNGTDVIMSTAAEDCGSLVGDQPTCADPSWTLYYDAYAFCCTSDQVGIQGNQCQPKSLTFSEGLYAATVSHSLLTFQPPRPETRDNMTFFERNTYRHL